MACKHLSHAALRLLGCDTGYAPLWNEQLGNVWREDRPAFTWPVLEGDDARWAVRAAIDAVVADAYGLSRDQYGHVLSTFSHKSYPNAPDLCLAAFDELKAIGLEAFTKKHDPYWDIPLNENLPEPVIDLPIPDEARAAGAAGSRDRKGQTTFLGPGPLYAQADAQEPGPQPAQTPRRRGRKPKADAPEATEHDYQELLAALRNRGELTSADAQKLLNHPAATLRPLLKRLVEKGHAVKEGKGRGTVYRTAGTESG